MEVVGTPQNCTMWGHKNLVYTVLTPLAPVFTSCALLTPALASPTPTLTHLCPCRVTPLTPLVPVLTSFTYPCTCPCTPCICTPTVCDHPSDAESSTDYNSQTHSTGFSISQSCVALQCLITPVMQNLPLTTTHKLILLDSPSLSPVQLYSE